MEVRGNKARKAYKARGTCQLVRFSNLWFNAFLTTYFGIPGCHASGKMGRRHRLSFVMDWHSGTCPMREQLEEPGDRG